MEDGGQGFLQDPPRLGNQYIEDTPLREVLQRLLPEDVLHSIEPDLQRFGWRVVEECTLHGKNIKQQPPVLVQYNAWGRRIDQIRIGEGWKRLNDVSAEEGLIAIGYERKQKEYSRVYQFAKMHLFGPYSAVYTCPLSMTDGATRLCEIMKPRVGDDSGTPYSIHDLFDHYTSKDPAKFWTSGQWMTEKPGGSDVGNTETIARPVPGDKLMYHLHGIKFFTSATLSETAFALARVIDDKTGPTGVAGSRGLSLFYIQLRDDEGNLKNIKIRRLKEKLGTKSLPTAELELCGTPARLVGQVGRGVATIATLFNITRIYSASASVASMRKAIAVARDYAHRRHAFGKAIAELPLHVQTLAQQEVAYRGCLQLLFHTVLLEGKMETGRATKGENDLLRVLTTLGKLYTAKLSLATISECIEALGGNGYMEDATDLPELLREQQVNTIWEGTTNVLSMDILRILDREPNAFVEYRNHINRVVALPSLSAPLKGCADQVRQAVKALTDVVEAITHDMDTDKRHVFSQSIARDVSYAMAAAFIAALLIEHAAWPGGGEAGLTGAEDGVRTFAAQQWCARHLAGHVLALNDALSLAKLNRKKASYEATRKLGLDVDPNGIFRGMGDLCPVTGKYRARY